MPLLFRLVLMCVLVSAAVSAESEKHFFWKAELKESTIYLLGSIHLAKPDLYPLAEVIEKAFTDSQHLVVEVDLNDMDQTRLQEEFSKRALFQKGETIQDQVSAETYTLLTKELAEMGITLENVRSFEPWFLGLFLTNYEMQKLSFNPEFGVDRHFLNKAKETKKDILELESFDAQLSLLDELSKADQELFLVYTLRDLDRIESMIGDLLNSWKMGDAEKLEALLFDPLRNDEKLKPLYNVLFTKRNHEMAEKLEQYLEGNGKYFVVVGAGHLVGPDGIIELLEKKGYKIEQL